MIESSSLKTVYSSVVSRLFARRGAASFFYCAFLLLAVSLSAAAQEDPDPVKLFNQGQDAHEKGDFAAALKFYEQALEIHAEFPEAEFQRGAALESMGRDAEAEKAFRRAVELRENWTLPMASLGALLTKTNRFDEAEAVLNKTIELDAANAPAYAALAELKLKTKASPDALRALLDKIRLVSAKPDASLWAARGALERALGDPAAKTSLKNALALDAKNPAALAEAIEIALGEKNFPEALAAAQNFVRAAPGSEIARLLLARAHAASGNPAEALRLLETLDSRNPNVAALRDSIALNETSDVSELERQMEKNPANGAVLGRLCVLARVSAPAKALDYCRRASEAEPNNLNHAVGFGAALVQARQFEQAVGLFRRIIEIAPEDYAARANLATALFELKRYTEAKTEYLWLIAKKPSPIAYYFLAISRDNLAEYSEALESYRQFLQTADPAQNGLEIEKVNLRLPSLQKLIKQSPSKKGQRQ